MESLQFKVFVFKDKDRPHYSYIVAAIQEMAELELKQFTHRSFEFVKSRELNKMDSLKAFMIYNEIKPFE